MITLGEGCTLLRSRVLGRITAITRWLYLKVLGHSEIPETHSIRIGNIIGGTT